MKTWVFTFTVILVTSCLDKDDPRLGNRLFETNHTLEAGYSRYSYIGDKVAEVTHHTTDNGDSQYVFLKINYLNSSNTKIKSVIHQPDLVNIKHYDTLIYSGDNLTQIIKTIKKDGILIKHDTTKFIYNQDNILIKASNTSTKVEFLEFEGENFTQVKYYNSSRLKFDISLKYDNKVSPFKDLGYLNLVFFNLYGLEGLSYLTKNNILEIKEINFQSIELTLTTIYYFDHKYDAISRPILVTTTRKDDNEFKVSKFYSYN